MTVSAPIRTKDPVVQVKPKASGKRLKTIASVIAFQMVALLFVEAVLYWIGMGEEDIYKLDSTLGFQHFPNKRVTWRSEGFSQSYFDADGMRDPGLTIAKPANVYRIALLGDSMVEGLQVPIEQTFGKLIEKKLNQSGKRSVQILNFGNSGYSTAQEYLQLKQKVFKYQPDLVVLGYMSRDMFENWSPPDQTITNVRPYALHLPGRELVVDSSPVRNWMRSSRAKFMLRMEWLRQNSRIWGLVSAAQTQLSFNDPVYKAITSLITRPGKTLRAWGDDIKHAVQHPISLEQLLATPSFKINFFESSNQRQSQLVNSSISRAPRAIPKAKFIVEPPIHAVNADSAPAASSPASTATNTLTTAAVAGNKTYVDLMTRTMHSLVALMRNECAEHNAKMAVLLVPCRTQLSPTPGMETSFFNISYNDEISIMSDICRSENIPLFNAEAAAEAIPQAERPSMFYLMHMNAKGHEYLASKLYPFLFQLSLPGQ